MSSIAYMLLASAALQANVAEQPPEIREVSACVCTSASKSVDVVLSGFVVDAEVTLGSDRLSVEDLMATIFDVKTSDDPSYTGRTKVQHFVSDAKCGVTFDYGKEYEVAVRFGEEGDLETDRCLMSTLN